MRRHIANSNIAMCAMSKIATTRWLAWRAKAGRRTGLFLPCRNQGNHLATAQFRLADSRRRPAQHQCASSRRRRTDFVRCSGCHGNQSWRAGFVQTRTESRPAASHAWQGNESNNHNKYCQFCKYKYYYYYFNYYYNYYVKYECYTKCG